MGDYDKVVRDVIDHGDRRRSSAGLKPAPPIGDIKRRPTEQMIWHLRHKPYEIGGDTDAERNADRAEIRE